MNEPPRSFESRRRTSITARRVAFLLVATAGSVTLPAQEGHGQPSTDPGNSSGAAIFAGAVLGLYSAGMATNLGSTVWCTETAWGAGCIRSMTILGAAAGAAAGAHLGDADSDAVGRTAMRASIGFAIGGAFGLAAMQAKSAVRWRDALMLGFVGGAIGARPIGAALGFAGGGLIGLTLESILPGFGIPEVVATMLAGMAVGITAEWIVAAGEARSSTDSVSFSVPLVRISF